MPKYSLKDGSERMTCSQTCHNRRISALPEVRAKYSEIAKRTYEKMSQDPEYMEWLRNKGKHLSEFHKDDFNEKAAERMAALQSNPEWRERWRTGYDASRPAAQKKIRIANRKNWDDPEYRAAETDRLRIARMVPGVNEKISIGLKKAHADGKFLEVYNSYLELRRTSLERLVELPLFLGNIPYERNLRVFRYYIDFAIPLVMIGIEADGYYWHSRRIEEDIKRDAYLAGRGWAIIRLSEAEIKGDVINALSIKVFPVIESALKLLADD